ncbi:MAG: 3-deoxy-manno-octulosonate cytidylyltransferase [Parvibaculales bacterium]
MDRQNVIIIPARLQSSRLPNKPLADMHGVPMIIEVWKRAMEAGVAPVVVAAGDKEIADVIEAEGGVAICTDPALPSGSDRCFAALQKLPEQEKITRIVNLQGDLPTLAPSAIRKLFAMLDDGEIDIATLGVPITEAEDGRNPNIVKIGVSMEEGARQGRAFYFTRSPAPFSFCDEPLYHHIGIYGYQRAALERFIALPPSVLEKRERLEQWRALEAGLRVEVAMIDSHPFGVDTPSDLERAREILKGGKP